MDLVWSLFVQQAHSHAFSSEEANYSPTTATIIACKTLNTCSITISNWTPNNNSTNIAVSLHESLGITIYIMRIGRRTSDASKLYMLYVSCKGYILAPKPRLIPFSYHYFMKVTTLDAPIMAAALCNFYICTANVWTWRETEMRWLVTERARWLHNTESYTNSVRLL